MIDLAQAFDTHLLEKNDQESKRPIAGNATWRASRLGSCMRAQYLEHVLHVEPLIPLDALSLRRFEIGHFWTNQFKRWFEEMGLLLHEEYELHDPSLDIGAHADFIVGNKDWKAGVELKSMQSRYFWYRKKEGSETVASPAHLIQASVYDHLCQQQGINMPWYVITVSKDDLSIHQIGRAHV